jgi:alcohol dehydrogenase
MRALRRPKPEAIRPHGALRHYAGLMGPDALAVMPAMFERDVTRRLGRSLSAARGHARQRVKPSRQKMRSLQALPGGKLRWKDVPAPAAPGAHAAVVHPIAIATCDLDCPLAMGMLQMPLPLHLGHECVAEVLAIGELVKSVRPGEKVIVPYEISCGQCPQCKAGFTASCATVPPVSAFGMGFATGHFGGAYADMLTVPFADAMLVALPEDLVPSAAASVSDNICDAYRHLAPHLPSLLAREPDAQVLILAAQDRKMPFGFSLPLYCGLIAKAFGAREVCLIDARARVRAHAQLLGIEALPPRALRKRKAAPLVIDTSVNALGLALAKTAPDGVCSSAGSLHRAAKVPIATSYVRKVTLHVGRTSARPLMPAVLELMREGRFQPERVISTLASLEEAPRVLREHFLAGGTKAVLTI